MAAQVIRFAATTSAARRTPHIRRDTLIAALQVGALVLGLAVLFATLGAHLDPGAVDAIRQQPAPMPMPGF